jgi:hypothetical protein
MASTCPTTRISVARRTRPVALIGARLVCDRAAAVPDAQLVQLPGLVVEVGIGGPATDQGARSMTLRPSALTTAMLARREMFLPVIGLATTRDPPLPIRANSAVPKSSSTPTRSDPSALTSMSRTCSHGTK